MVKIAVYRKIVKTIPERCKQCYSCVRNCPVKAVKIENGQAQVLQERCIYCGNCIKMCSQNAKKILDGLEIVEDLLKSKDYTVAMLAPSYPASFDFDSGKVVSALKSLGFDEVWEVALGAELVAQEYQKLNQQKKSVISSTCPAVVNFIQKHHSDLIPYLAPVMSPAQVTAKLIKESKKNKKIKTVFIGPCIAKKSEMDESGMKGLISEVVTFEDCKRMFEYNNIDLNNQGLTEFDSPPASLGYLLPLPGGLLKSINASNDLLAESFVEANGMDSCISTIEALKVNKGNIRILDCLFCEGCISGPKIDDSGNNYVNKKNKIINRLREVPVELQIESKKELVKRDIDIKRNFYDLSCNISIPTEDEINNILKETDKEKDEDRLNCGACGYSSCKEKAIAVYQGIAENEMCLPHLLKQKNYLLNSVEERLEKEKQLSEELENIIQSSYDGICVTNDKGIVLRVNDSFEQMLDMDKSKVIGSSVQQLEEQSILSPSISLLVMKSKKPVTIIQTIQGNKKVLATGNPVFSSQGQLKRIIVNTRDIQQFQELRTQIEQVMDREGRQINNGNKLSVIAHSREFNEVLDVASRVAKVDSTVLILGESGVGKEVVANYIHSHSKRKEQPFVKINCTTIPETLLESELFGYDSGAFTGAKKQGKKGLLEMANGGTVFLDEIGELPMSQQVKLLRVLQEKQIMRIGGTKALDIDVRIVTATNKNLADMVKEGKFRADLYYRLNVVPVTIPPLRERVDDIIPLIYFFLDLYNKKYFKDKELSKEAKQMFLNYSWPGNVRELQNTVERLVVTAENDIILIKDLEYLLREENRTDDSDIKVNGIIPLKKALEEVERQLIEKTRSLYDSTYKIAEVLEVNQSTIVRKMQKYSNNR